MKWTLEIYIFRIWTFICIFKETFRTQKYYSKEGNLKTKLKDNYLCIFREEIFCTLFVRAANKVFMREILFPE